LTGAHRGLAAVLAPRVPKVTVLPGVRSCRTKR